MPPEEGLTQLLIEIVVDPVKRARFNNKDDRPGLLDEFVMAPATRNALLEAESQRTTVGKLIDNQQTATGTVAALEQLITLAVEEMQRRRSVGGSTSQEAGPETSTGQ